MKNYLLEHTVNEVEDTQAEYAVEFNYNYTPGDLNNNWKPFNGVFN